MRKPIVMGEHDILKKRMETLLIEKEGIRVAVDLLSQNRIVVIPTETVYGLAGNAESDYACREIYRIKNRPQDNPLIVHCNCIDMARLCMKENPSSNELLMIHRALTILMHCSPGPVTVIVPSSERISSVARAGGATVAIRIPNHPIAQKIIADFGKPIVAPSANMSGRPSATNALMAWEDLCGKVSGIVDGGDSHFGLESTIVDCSHSDDEGYLLVLREGSIMASELSQKTGLKIRSMPRTNGIASGIDSTLEKNNNTQKNMGVTPGAKYAHYAPRCEIQLIESEHFSLPYVQAKVGEYANSKERIALAYVSTDRIDLGNTWAFSRYYESWDDLGKNVYELFAEADRRAIELLFLTVPPRDKFPALVDRITRAAQR